MTDPSTAVTQPPRLYEDEGDHLMQADQRADRVILLPSGDPRDAGRERIRLMWGQHLLADVVSGRYRTVICGVNEEDNSSGILGELLRLIPTSQWTLWSATSYARVFQDSVGTHASGDREPYVLKFDLDGLLILGLLRPRGKDRFTVDDLERGFTTVAKMLASRYDRRPVASVSFLGAKSNRLVGADGAEPSFEAVLRAMYRSGFRGDVYPPLRMWELAPTGVFASYPFPEGLDTMREGGH